MYSRIKSTKSTASGAGNVSEPEADVPSRESVRNCVCLDRCVSAVRAVEVAVFVCLSSRCNHVTEGEKPYSL
jgi:hypothetical protein